MSVEEALAHADMRQAQEQARLLAMRASSLQRAPTICGPEDLELCHDYILVQLLPNLITARGIALPDSADRQGSAIVLKTGPGRMSEYGVRSEVTVFPGDIVQLNPNPLYEPDFFESDDRSRKFLIIRDRDLYCKFSGAAKEQYLTLLQQLEDEEAKQKSA
jgi:co-chaperonin GroES (HSP10)